MRIIIEVQTNPIGDEFMEEREETVKIFTCREKVIIEREDVEQLIIPIEVFSGLLR